MLNYTIEQKPKATPKKEGKPVTVKKAPVKKSVKKSTSKGE